MNILMFVMTMLMILAIMTYAKIESFRASSGTHLIFENYIENIERKAINEQAEAEYDAIHLKRNGNGNNGGNHRSSAKSTLPIGSLIDGDAASEESQFAAAMLKGLIINLYGSYSFFKTAQHDRPDIVDEIISSLHKAKESMGPNFKITSAKDLANLDLGDETLNEFFYLILKGNSITYKNSEGIVVEEGFPSLLKFINSDKGKKVRVYLAAKPVLQVLFDPAAADEIITTRYYFYREVANGTLEANDATERFESMFITKVNPLVPLKKLDFSVTKTRPSTR